MVWHAVHPIKNFRRWQEGWVRAVKLEASYHWGITWVCIYLAEAFNDMVDEGSLGQRYGAGRPVMANCNAQ